MTKPVSRRHRIVLCLALGKLFAAAATAEEVTWPPPTGLLDTDNRVVVRQLLPGALIRIEARERADNGTVWRAFATYMADDTGIVDTHSSPALAGTWTGVDASGWLWSMVPEAVTSVTELQQAINDEPALLRKWQRPGGAARQIALEIREGARLMGSTHITRWRIAPDVGVEDIAKRDHGVAGKLLLPGAKPARRALAVVALGGSFGGLSMAEAQMLASHGYPVLALAYFKYEGLTDSGSLLPLEYFAQAIDWLRRYQDIEHVALLGKSRGGEAVLLFGSLYPNKADALIAYVPSHLVNNGEGEAWGDWLTDERSMWTHKGNPVPFVPYVDSQTPAVVEKRQRLKSGLPGYAIAQEYALIWQGEADGPYAIDLQRIRVPTLVLAGAVDGIWPSGMSANIIRRTVDAGDRTNDWTVEIFPEAGHSWGLPNDVASLSEFAYVGQNFNGFIALGGSAKGNAAAARRAWDGLLNFLADVETAHTETDPAVTGPARETGE